MLTIKFFRTLLLPLGLIIKLYELAVIGSRDLHNNLRYRKAIIDRNCCINRSSIIEENCHILENSLILNSSIKRFSYVGRNSIIQNASVGSFCSIANDVFIGLGTHPKELFSTSPLFYRTFNTLKYKLIDKDSDFMEYRPIQIGHDVWIGARAIVLDGVNVDDGAIIAANAVVTKDVPPYAIVGGIPAKVIMYRFSPEKVEKLLSIKWWEWPLSDIYNRMKGLNNL
jgi:acetyltransferase-like isoleucine patch superfamily enzyme